MDTISWEQLQNIANNMLKKTDNPDELLMLYLFKLHSLYLDTPVELHHHFAQSLLNTGMFDDPVLKNLYGEFLNDEVSDMKQYDVLTHNMPQMLEAYGGYRRSKLNKRKNKSAGNSGEQKKSNALVTTKGPGAMVVANSSALSASNQSHRDLIDTWKIAPGVRGIKVGNTVSAQIPNNAAYAYIEEEIESTKKQCDEDEKKLINDRDQKITDLDNEIEKKKQEIKERYQSQVWQCYLQIGADILFWLLGALIVYGLKSAPIFPESAINLAADWSIGYKTLWTIEYIFIAGCIGGWIKAGFLALLGFEDYSLAVSDLVAQDTTKGKAAAWAKIHSLVHIGKIIVQRFKLPQPEDIFQLEDFKNFVKDIKKQKEAVNDKYLNLILKLKDDCNHRIEKMRNQLIEMGKDFTTFTTEDKTQLSLENGGMKKQSKKYLKKTRKSRY